MSAQLLRSYSQAALLNADELLVEAALLRDHGHNARAYFLAVACVEESGKALLAFDSQNRNLSDPAVCTKLKVTMENHASKLNYALGRWAMASPDPRGALKLALDLISHLKHGREPSMYSDVSETHPDQAQTPREVVSTRAAQDAVKLAAGCLAHAHRHVAEAKPIKPTPSQDRIFTMKAAKFQEVLSTKDFLLYYVARLEAGLQDIAEAVLAYERDHIKTGRPFHDSW